ncbi:glycine--tRNA ligase subunit beta [Algicola sagamiensis]|uniref:glycine--tRNA ligase subunit beta n=1 Tax=Algicola sagamiensis TaxID=163869 RepID=UPI00035E0440|nr:glycine--tRNA ligase subunit beta [Algicola sagamiensis]
MSTQDFLVELGTEELPPKSLRRLATAFADNIQDELKQADLDFEDVVYFASPRRLAIRIKALVAQQKDKVVEKRGPSLQAAFDAEGQPTKAAEGWARSNGITVDQAERLETEKGAWLLHKAEVKGKTVTQIMPEIVATALKKLPIPKPMRWGRSSVQFIRPVKTLTMLYGDMLIEGTVLGLSSARQSQGHRFHHPGMLEISDASSYEETLKSGYVIACFDERKSIIKKQIEAEATKLGGHVEDDDSLLDEVTALVEWPVTLVGTFEEKFLDVPAEALSYSMKDNQKYFPVFDQAGKLTNQFIFVSNIESKDPSQVISGNEKVIRPRLADAEFFFQTDKKQTLESRIISLGNVLFQKQLGTLKEKSERIGALAECIAESLHANTLLARRAGLLSKTDLMTEMVMEFPEVQGVMGKYYAQHDGEDKVVANALYEQYLPRFSGDVLPQSMESCAVALADKMDTLIGIFGIGQVPKGDKDPFALRRAAIGALRIIVEKELPLDIERLALQAVSQYQGRLTNDKVVADVVDFMLGRFRSWYQDEGVAVDVIQAVLAKRPTEPADFDKRIKAVNHFRTLPSAESLAAANKRVGNILAKYSGELPEQVDASLLSEVQEQALASQIDAMKERVEPMMGTGDYQHALTALSELKEAIDAFFDHVMVMAEDEAVKVNRLTMLSQLRKLFVQIADISLLQS